MPPMQGPLLAKDGERNRQSVGEMLDGLDEGADGQSVDQVLDGLMNGVGRPARLGKQDMIKGVGENGNKGSSARRQWNVDQKVRIVIESLKSAEPNVKICRRYGISEPTLYKWRQQFFDGGKMYLSGTTRPSQADLATENRHLKEVIAETLLALENGLGVKARRPRRRGSGPARERS